MPVGAPIFVTFFTQQRQFINRNGTHPSHHNASPPSRLSRMSPPSAEPPPDAARHANAAVARTAHATTNCTGHHSNRTRIHARVCLTHISAAIATITAQLAAAWTTKPMPVESSTRVDAPPHPSQRAWPRHRAGRPQPKDREARKSAEASPPRVTPIGQCTLAGPRPPSASHAPARRANRLEGLDTAAASHSAIYPPPRVSSWHGAHASPYAPSHRQKSEARHQ